MDRNEARGAVPGPDRARVDFGVVAPGQGRGLGLVPACQNAGVWASATVARFRVFIRTRSAMGVWAGSLMASRSKSVSLSCAST